MKIRSLIFIFFLISISSALTVDDVEKDVMCVCGCGKVLENCECATAERMRKEIGEMIAKGMTKEEIISELQATYGKEVLVNPPKEGVFLGLWYYPVAITIAGVSIVYVLLKRRGGKWYGDPDETINVDEEYLER
ncbi:cytochrome c-type biogenesis protein CcmH [Ferroglobus sp.]|uniref:cytochrome c-type biogenesis protein n=1 Tax=Ferroglobus sp. TaxID=2614230 RepID=UPI0025C06112|nr:cytochrome c-type biogenesis protein CcmH [Ferroglobus sp.]